MVPGNLAGASLFQASVEDRRMTASGAVVREAVTVAKNVRLRLSEKLERRVAQH